jgi:hypothetical protein
VVLTQNAVSFFRRTRWFVSRFIAAIISKVINNHRGIMRHENSEKKKKFPRPLLKFAPLEMSCIVVEIGSGTIHFVLSCLELCETMMLPVSGRKLYTLSPLAALQSHSVKAVCHHYLRVVVCAYLSQKPDRQNTDDDGESKPSRVMRCSVSGSINHRRRSWSRRCSSIRCTSHRRSRARCLNCRRWGERYTRRGGRCRWRERRLRYGDARRWRCRDAWRAGRLRLSGAT